MVWNNIRFVHYCNYLKSIQGWAIDYTISTNYYISFLVKLSFCLKLMITSFLSVCLAFYIAITTSPPENWAESVNLWVHLNIPAICQFHHCRGDMAPPEPQTLAPAWLVGICSSIFLTSTTLHPRPGDYLHFLWVPFSLMPSFSLSPLFPFLLENIPLGTSLGIWENKVVDVLIMSICPQNGFILWVNRTSWAEIIISQNCEGSFYRCWLPVLLLRHPFLFWFSTLFI